MARSFNIVENTSNQAANRDPWRRWRIVLVAVLALFLTAVFFDEPVTRALINWPESERAVFEWITRWGESDWIQLPTLAISIIAYAVVWSGRLNYTPRWAIRSVGAISGFIFLGTGAPGLTAAIAKRVIGRARPIHLEELGPWNVQPIQFDWSLGGFPSGHATTAFSLAMVLVLLFGARWRWVFLFAILIGLSRIVVGMHYLTDVAAGMALGTIGAILVQRFYLWRNWVFREENGVIRNRMLAPMRRYWQRLRSG